LLAILRCSRANKCNIASKLAPVYRALASSTATPMALLEVIVFSVFARLFNDQSFANAD
jgi:hypothetical protein